MLIFKYWYLVNVQRVKLVRIAVVEMARDMNVRSSPMMIYVIYYNTYFLLFTVVKNCTLFKEGNGCKLGVSSYVVTSH